MKNPFGSLARSFVPALLLLACSSEDGSPKEDGNHEPPEEAAPAATDVGTELDDAVSGDIGPEGGSLTSADGRLTVTVPEGALDEDTTLEIQPITNEAHGGVGSAYRLSPDGLAFAVPATLAFAYEDADLAGTDAAVLGVAFQDDDRYWSWMESPVVDGDARTVSVDTHHFTDFSAVSGVVLLPAKGEVSVGDTFALRMATCYPPSVGEDELQPLGYQCDDPDDPELVFPGIVTEWAVNGVAGGTSDDGTVRASSDDGRAIYTAPDEVPSPSTVTVSARVQGTDALWLLASNVEITGAGGGYSGDVEFESPINGVTNGTASVTWRTVTTNSDNVRYVGEGTMSYTLTLDGCSPVTVTGPLQFEESGDGCGSGSCLTVYDDTADAPNTYEFIFANEEVLVNLRCGEDTSNPYELADYPALFVVNVTYCPPDGFPSYVTDDVLAGSYACDGSNQTSSWSFSKN
jgi:hypothetical protein